MSPTDQPEPGADRAQVLERLADGIPTDAGRPVTVAVDGVDGAGKSTLGDQLAEVLRRRGHTVVRATLDDFHHPRELRYAHGRTPETVWARSFDYEAVRRELLDPWREGPGASYRTGVHDVRTDEPLDRPAETVPDSGVLLVDGVFAQRPELEGCWDHVIYLDVPFEFSVSRMAARDGTANDVHDPDQVRYIGAQMLYFDFAEPWQTADVVLDNTDVDHPKVV